MATRINGAIARLARDQPVFYTGSHTGAELTFEAGQAMADTWADYINVGMEHGPLDIPGLNRFMQGMASVRTPTPVVLVELPFEGRDPDLVRANAWQIRQLLVSCPASFWYFRVRHARQCKAWSAGNIRHIRKGHNAAVACMAISRRARSTGPGVAFAEWGPADMAMSHGFLDPRLGRSTLAAARQRVFDACKAAGIFFLDTCTEENLAAQLAAGVRISMGTRELQALARELMA